jgi:hypothetical protein
MKRHLLLLLFVCSVFADGNAQRKGVFASLEDSIIQLHKEIILESNTIRRYQKNDSLLYLLEETMELKNSISYPFDSLKTISVLTSSDKKMRIFTWYLISDDGIHEHYGFVQVYNEEKKQYKVYSLTDRWKRMNNPASQSLTCNNWYGAVYTELVEIKGSNDNIYYTLLGWNGGDIFSQRKVIEVLSINNKRLPVFGALIFRGYTKTPTMRIVFEYAKHSFLFLHYDRQLYTDKNTKKIDKQTNTLWIRCLQI